MTDGEALARRFRRCTGLDVVDPRRARVAAALVRDVAAHPTWSVHRHVHLVAAFDEARGLVPVTSVLAVGCGLGLSELFLAVCHPGIHVTLTDVDPARLRLARRTARAHGITNVSFRALDLLGDRGPDRFDLVTGIEVLEHIDDDERAARHLRGVARHLVYQLVPACTPAALVDPVRIRRERERHEHVRPGYTPETLRALFGGAAPVWVRHCYRPPEAPALRARLAEMSRRQRRSLATELLAAAVSDVRADRPGEGAGAGAGIEILVAAGELPPRPLTPPADPRVPLPPFGAARRAVGEGARVATAVRRRLARPA